MRAPVQDQLVNYSEKQLNESDLGIIHPHWWNVPDLPAEGYRVMGVFGVIVYIFAFTGNFTVLHLIFRHPSLRTISNLLVLNLTIADFIMSTGNIPAFIISSFHGQWFFGVTGCRVYAFIGACSSFVSINSLAAIAVDRCFVIVKGLQWKDRLSGKAVRRFVTLIWVYSILWASTPFFGFGNYILEGTNTSCTFDFLTRSFNIRLYVLLIFTVHFVIPLLAIITSYIMIYRAILQHNHEFSRASRVYGETDLPLTVQQTKKGVSYEAKIARVSLIVISVFCLSWTPYASIALLGAFGKLSQVTRLSAGISCMLAKFSTVCNPLIYALLHPKFRNKLLDLRLCQRLNVHQRRSSVRRTSCPRSGRNSGGSSV